MANWNELAKKATVDKTIESLKQNGIDAYYLETAGEAAGKVRTMLPDGAEVMVMSSTTLESCGIAKEIQESGRYDSIRKRLMAMDRKTEGSKMQKLGAAPQWAVGSVHAVTQDGRLMIASQSGSQLPAYAYGSEHVIWVVGTQKIVKNIDEGFKRIYEHCLPLESERAKKAYGTTGSSVNKVLIVNKEIKPGRISVLFVNQVLGF